MNPLNSAIRAILESSYPERDLKLDDARNLEGQIPGIPGHQLSEFQAEIDPFVDNIPATDIPQLDRIKDVLSKFKGYIDKTEDVEQLEDSLKASVKSLIKLYHDAEDEYPEMSEYPQYSGYCKGFQVLVQIRVARKVHELGTLSIAQKNRYLEDLRVRLAAIEAQKRHNEEHRVQNLVRLQSPLPPYFESGLKEITPPGMTEVQVRIIVNELRQRHIKFDRIYGLPPAVRTRFLIGFGPFGMESSFYGPVRALMDYGVDFESIIEPKNPKPENHVDHNPTHIMQNAPHIQKLLMFDAKVNALVVRNLKQMIQSISQQMRQNTMQREDGEARTKRIEAQIENENRKLTNFRDFEAIPELTFCYNLRYVNAIIEFRKIGVPIKDLIALEPQRLQHIILHKDHYRQFFVAGLNPKVLKCLPEALFFGIMGHPERQNRAYFQQLQNVVRQWYNADVSSEVISSLSEALFDNIAAMTPVKINLLKLLEQSGMLIMFSKLPSDIKAAFVDKHAAMRQYNGLGARFRDLLLICAQGVDVVNKIAEPFVINQVAQIRALGLPFALLTKILMVDLPLGLDHAHDELPMLSSLITIVTPAVMSQNSFVNVTAEDMYFMLKNNPQFKMLLDWGYSIDDIKPHANHLEELQESDQELLQIGMSLDLLLDIRNENSVLIDHENVRTLLTKITREVFEGLDYEVQKELVIGARVINSYKLKNPELKLLLTFSASTVKCFAFYEEQISLFLRRTLPVGSILGAIEEMPKLHGLIGDPTFFTAIETVFEIMGKNGIPFPRLTGQAPDRIKYILVNADAFSEAIGSPLTGREYRQFFDELIDAPDLISFLQNYYEYRITIKELYSGGYAHANIYSLFSPPIVEEVMQVFQGDQATANALANLNFSNLQIVAIMNDDFALTSCSEDPANMKNLKKVLRQVDSAELRTLDATAAIAIVSNPLSYENLFRVGLTLRNLRKLDAEAMQVFDNASMFMVAFLSVLSGQRHRHSLFFNLEPELRLFILQRISPVLDLMRAGADFRDIINTNVETLGGILNAEYKASAMLRKGSSWADVEKTDFSAKKKQPRAEVSVKKKTRKRKKSSSPESDHDGE